MLTIKKQTRLDELLLSAAYEEYERGMHSYVQSKLNGKQTHEDLVQDTFMKTWQYLVKGGKIDLMKAFLYHILNNLIVDEYRKQKITSLEVLLKNGFEPSVDDTDRVISILDGKAAMLLLKRLPVKYQKVMRMRYVQSLSLKEMALLTGQSKNTVAVQLHRGLEKLKTLYTEA